MAKQSGTTTAPVRTSAPPQPGRNPVSAGSAPHAPSRPQNAAPDPEAVRLRAFEIYQSRGQAEGSAMEDWLQAERELRAKATNRRV